MTPRVVLVGPPGAGKTTVGMLLAERLGIAFRDTDDDVERTTGTSIADLFIDGGEEGFRSLERSAVSQALSDYDGVLALGGGAVLDVDTRTQLAAHRVVFLDVGLPDAATRIGLNRDRPLLLGNPRTQLKIMLDQRRGLYEEVATVVVDTAGRAPEDVVRDVESAL